jgi:hypothetical protein
MAAMFAPAEGGVTATMTETAQSQTVSWHTRTLANDVAS